MYFMYVYSKQAEKPYDIHKKGVFINAYTVVFKYFVNKEWMISRRYKIGVLESRIGARFKPG